MCGKQGLVRHTFPALRVIIPGSSYLNKERKKRSTSLAASADFNIYCGGTNTTLFEGICVFWSISLKVRNVNPEVSDRDPFHECLVVLTFSLKDKVPRGSPRLPPLDFDLPIDCVDWVILIFWGEGPNKSTLRPLSRITRD